MGQCRGTGREDTSVPQRVGSKASGWNRDLDPYNGDDQCPACRGTGSKRLLSRERQFDYANGTSEQNKESKKEENMRMKTQFTPNTAAKIAALALRDYRGDYDVFFQLAYDGKKHPDYTVSGTLSYSTLNVLKQS